jgi:hypothetical protein
MLRKFTRYAPGGTAPGTNPAGPGFPTYNEISG